MRVLKFIGGEPPESIFLDETIGFNDSGTPSGYSLSLYETLGFREIIPEGITEVVYETIGFGDSYFTGYNVVLYDTIGFSGNSDETEKVHLFETIGFGDYSSQELANSITFYETIGFNEGGFNEIYNEHDITITWRTRTPNQPYGYGASEYGSIVSYGDGDASGLATFELHLWKVGGPDSNRWLNSNPAGEYDDRYHKEVITITDTDYPDDDATYTLTIANNISYCGSFVSDFEVEIFVKDSNGVYSFGKVLITPTLKIYIEE